MNDKRNLNWKDWAGFLTGLISWLYLGMVLIGAIPASLRHGIDSQLWMLGILNAFWLLCAVGFLFCCAGLWEQKKDSRKMSWVTLGGCFLSGGFILFPFFGFFVVLLFKL